MPQNYEKSRKTQRKNTYFFSLAYIIHNTVFVRFASSKNKRKQNKTNKNRLYFVFLVLFCFCKTALRLNTMR